VSRHAEKAAVITAGIEIAHIKIPVVRGEDMKIGLHQLPPPDF
jgi:hypothetical protein